jgi:hypothetical protein
MDSSRSPVCGLSQTGIALGEVMVTSTTGVPEVSS